MQIDTDAKMQSRWLKHKRTRPKSAETPRWCDAKQPAAWGMQKTETPSTKRPPKPRITRERHAHAGRKV